MQSVSVFLDITKLSDFQRKKKLISAETEEYVT